MQIQPYEPQYRDAVIDLALRAWAPVFVSIEQALDPAVYQVFYPEGWRTSQQQAVTEVCADPETHVWVAAEEGVTVGFVAVKRHPASQMGEIYMIATDPAYQRRGYASTLTDFALAWLKDAGMAVAMVETGGDPGHAPARRTYESRGFRLLPVARYFKKL